MNWRKPIIYLLLYLSGSKVPHYLKEIKRIEKLPYRELKNYQERKLKKLLLHTYKNVPYYKKVLKKAKVVENDKVNLKHFSKIPILTKEIIRKHFHELKSNDLQKRKWFYNTSGGSTGEPIRLIQDKAYWEMNGLANKMYFNLLNSKDIGEYEIDLWGSMRDMLRNSYDFKDRAINYIYNRRILNFFKITEQDMKNYVKIINKTKPKSMWVYAESAEVFANFIERNNLKVHAPDFILSTASTLYPEMRKKVETVFRCPVMNQYGSREVGAMTVECKHKAGHHHFPWSHYIEVINGEIIVTVLTNYAMPLLRYRIGDLAEKSKTPRCKCGRDTLIFKEVKGKTIAHFKNRKGELMSAQYIIRLMWFKDWIKKFQLIQKGYDLIEYNIVLNGKPNKKDMKELEKRVKDAMGKECKIQWNFVNDIKPTKSGKFLYTVSEID